MSFDRSELTKILADHGRVARVVIVETKGSVPRNVGASMFVWEGGQSGTIGGGALEFDAASKALKGPSVKTIPLGPNLGQCCGGSVTLVTEIFTEEIPESQLFTRQIKGIKDIPVSILKQMATARRGENVSLVFENGWLSEPLSQPKTPLWIYGAGHVGRALVDVIAPLPTYEITWVDVARARFPEIIPDHVNQLHDDNPDRLVTYAPPHAHHLILTFSHALDLALCHNLLNHSFTFAGLIGSNTKWARFKSRLAELGHSKGQISRITCPIGDPNLGKHPQEIAVGVATSLLSRRNQVTPEKEQAL